MTDRPFLLRIHRLPRTLAVLGIGLFVAGCENPGQTFGFQREAPDEFSVVARAPLVVPPDFNLRPPAPGTPRPQETAPVDAARNQVFGSASRTSTARPDAQSSVSTGQRALLARAGADNVDPQIRRQVDEESTALAQKDDGFVNKIMFWREPPAPGEVVDPSKENQRLRENSALGKPVTEGETPRIERKQQAPLEGLVPTWLGGSS